MTRRHRCPLGLAAALAVCSAAALAACATEAPRDAAAGSPGTKSPDTQIADARSVTMTDTRTFGRILGETARAAQKVHLQVLTQEGTDFESWVAYTLLAENLPAMPTAALAADLARRLDIEPSAASRVLDRLASAGHARADGATGLIELTPAGTAFLARLRGTVNQVTHRLVGSVDKHDLDTTMNVLRAVGEAASRFTMARPPSR